MSRNFGLDLVRAISIWFVLLKHGGFNIPGMSPLTLGTIGVEVFFVLSGFLIGGILLREFESNDTFFKILKRFWVRRWYRILPLYYLAIFVKFIFIENEVGWNILYYVFFLQNNFYGISFYGVTWSLVIEEWFYLFAPFFLWVVLTKIQTQKLQLLALAGFLASIIGLRFGYVLLTDVGYSGINANFPFRFDSLFLGVTVAYIKRYYKNVFAQLASPKVFALGLVLFIGYISVFWSWANPVNLINEMLFPRTVGFFVLPFSIALTIPFISLYKTAPTGNILKLAYSWWVTKTSVYTYAIYLIHTIIFKYTFSTQFEILGDFGQMIFGIVITYVLAALVYRGFEKPILDFRDRTVKRNN